MSVIRLQDRQRLQAYFQRDIPLYLYALGDLDDFFFPHTRWFGLVQEQELLAVLLEYTASQPHVLLALAQEMDRPALRTILTQVQLGLPDEIDVHASPGIQATLAARYRLVDHGLHWKMQFMQPGKLPSGPFQSVSRLGPRDAAQLLDLYTHHYPEHAFDPRMLATGQYRGIWMDNQLVCAAGVHVYSPQYGVAALGNVVTHQDFRGRGLARQTVAALCQELQQAVPHIGLNVKADNLPAVRLYESLGFVTQVEYYEYSASRLVG
jgi:ribosomal protein S18 acetylase RimI-like enzyme